MAKGAYIGVGGKARKVKKGYIGVVTDIPIYNTTTATITSSNISTYFTVTNGTYYFVGYSDGRFESNNNDEDDTGATSIWKAKNTITNMSFNWSVDSESGYDKFTITVGDIVAVDGQSGEKSGSWSGSLAAGKTIELKYSKDSSNSVGNDAGIIKDISITIQTQTGTETRSVARKIKKAYIGVGGKARPCFVESNIAYYGVVTELYARTSRLAATSVGNYAVFAGGQDQTGAPRANMTAYNNSLVRSHTYDLDVGCYDLAATHVGNYAIFFGGQEYDNVTFAAYSYDSSLTKTRLGTIGWNTNSVGVTIGNYALFCGSAQISEEDDEYNSYLSEVVAYDTALTRSIPTELSKARGYAAATSVGNYALIGGGVGRGPLVGQDLTAMSVVDAYDRSLTRSVPTSFRQTRNRPAAATVGGYALFAGGSPTSNDSACTDIDAYNASLTRSAPTTLSTARSALASASTENFAIFAGGTSTLYPYDINPLSIVDVYDSSLTRSVSTPFSENKYEHASATVGNYVLFGGGSKTNSVYSSSGASNVVNAYLVS